jgi:tRNA (mo5U34)-methyltransferase
MDSLTLQQQIDDLGPWFYPFPLADGVVTPSKVPAEVQGIFETRREMLERAVREHFGDRLSAVSAVDVGCHEGFYTFALRAMGVPDVLGLDFREDNLRRARFVASQMKVSGARFLQADAENMDPAAYGVFPLTVCYGLLYHLENPMRALRRLYALTGELLVLETQVVDEVEGHTEWGSQQWTRPYHGVLAVIDETGEYQDGNQETGATPVVTCPSPKALRFLLQAAGFREVRTVNPPPDAYEQLARGKRVVVTARK